jgi:drug/metabolite transporter (DMT)-like permease
VAGSFIYLQPVLALLVTWLWIPDELGLGWPQALAAGCIFLGVWLVGRRERASAR